MIINKSELVKDVLNFATKKPEERLRSICDGLNILNYDESEYLKQFKMFTDQKPLEVQARILPPPKLQFGQKTTTVSLRLTRSMFCCHC